MRVEVSWRDGQLVTLSTVAGSAAEERVAGLPLGVLETWSALPRDGAATAKRLADAGRQLVDAMFGETGLSDVVNLVDRRPLGSAVDIVIIADEATASLPFELLQLPDGRPLVLAPNVSMTRRLAEVKRPATPSLAGPLKILAAIAAPTETRTDNRRLDVEAEMQAILDAVAGVEGSDRAQVTILEVGSREQIEQALGEAQYHVLHLSAHGSPAMVELENEDGDPIRVGAQQLVDALHGGGRPLPLIVLAASAGAARSDGLAATLVRRGADRVIAMLTTVTDKYATDLTAALYETLAGRSGVSVAAALGDARRAVEQRYAQAALSGGRVQPPEYGVATLLAAGDDPPLVDPDAATRPLAEPTVAPSGRTVRELPLGYLIGRRTELRTVLSVLRRTPTAMDRFGAVAGVVITGVGGIGKTALAGRAISRMRQQGWLVVVHEGRFNPPRLFADTADAIAHLAQQSQAATVLAQPGDDAVKLKIIEGLLAQARFLLVFDDFGQNLTEGGGAFLDDAVQAMFTGLCRAAGRGRIMVTCRYPVPDDGLLAEIRLPGLTTSELRRMFARLPALRTMPLDDQRLVMATIGGHPRLIEFVDALLRDGNSSLLPVADKLRTLAEKHHLSVDHQADPASATAQAVLLGSRDILLSELLGLLTDAQRELLMQAAISAVALDISDLAVALHGLEVTVDQQRATTAAARRLTELTLFSPAPDGQIAVHPWLTDALHPYQDDRLADRHERALAMHLHRLTNQPGSYDDIAEACHHLATLERYDELTAMALAATGSGIGEAAIATLLGAGVAAIPTDHRGHLRLLQREADALFATGNTRAAAQRLHRLHAFVDERARAEPNNVEAQRDLSVSLDRLGELATALGDTKSAARHYQDGLAIAQRLAKADPDNAQAQRDLAISHEQRGNLAIRLGDTKTAARRYKDSLAISRRLADADPDNAEAQRDLSISHTLLGDLAFALGKTTTAARRYTDCLTIMQRLADADPDNAELQRDLSISHNKLGGLALALDDTTTAARHYTASLTIAQGLAGLDPDNAQALRDLSISHNNLGDLALELDDTTTAARHYTASLTIAQRLADVDPDNAQAQRDLFISHNQLGNLARELGHTTTAARRYAEALAIAQRLADADPANGRARQELKFIRDKLERLGSSSN